MEIAVDRLTSLIEYAKQTVLLRSKPVLSIAQHKQFRLYEEEIRELPGLHLGGEDEDGEVWLKLYRQSRAAAPAIESALLSVWCGDISNPLTMPALRTAVEVESLVAIGYAGNQNPSKEEAATTALAGFAHRQTVEELYDAYLTSLWHPWAERQKKVIASIELYGKLFALIQQLQGSLVDSPVELVWGAGVAVWKADEAAVEYPLITRLVELSLNEVDMSIEVRPRSTSARLEIEPFANLDAPGIPQLERAWADWTKAEDYAFSPLACETFDGVLRSAVTLLHEEGVYWPEQHPVGDRALPKADAHLKVTDTWVLFSRPRTAGPLVDDLDKFLKSLKTLTTGLSEAVTTLVADPAEEHADVTLPAFRGLSPVDGDGASAGGEVADLFFPMPYNDEQVRTVQLLEVNPGVVVQGPPGTGKTHTIANIICHYLAHGKKVLVTSMKDPALSVIAEKLPEAIRPLAVSMLTSEAEGMKQFEHSIARIATEIVQVDKRAHRQQIVESEHQIQHLHADLARTAAQIKKWAAANLTPITLDGETIQPYEWAQRVVAATEDIGWLTDAISVGEEHAPLFTDEDLMELRSARKTLREDLAYLGKHVPQLTDFPSPSAIHAAHQDLSHAEELRQKEAEGTVPGLADRSAQTLERARALSEKTADAREAVQSLETDSAAAWRKSFLLFLQQPSQGDIKAILEGVKGEVLALNGARTKFITAPVDLGEASPLTDAEILEGIRNKAEGERPFGLLGVLGKGEQKRKLATVKVSGQPPQSDAEWKHVLDFVLFQQAITKVLGKWSAIAAEVPLPQIDAAPERLSVMVKACEELQRLQQLQLDVQAIKNEGKAVLPEWNIRFGPALPTRELGELHEWLTHHLTKSRLAQTWATKEALLTTVTSSEGPVAERLRAFATAMIGSPTVADTAIQTEWSALTDEVRRVHALSGQLKTVQQVSATIAESGAPAWAACLQCQACTGASDPLVPDNALTVWKLRRLTTFLESSNRHEELKGLSQKRADAEVLLAKLYQQVVEKRTWLKLAENATPQVSAALEAFRRAIRKIGKGTGVRASRFRADAREASAIATKAVPCWIMPHYRISESLPSELSLFDLVIIDEASQSDLSALPAILRAKKVLIVGDDKQVSPEGIGLEEDKVRNLMERFLKNQVSIYRQQLSPERSIYDLFNVAFSHSKVMLREHFRSVGPIIEYSKREFYNGELRPLRLPKSSERLDPPLVDVFIRAGLRTGKENHAEADYIIGEIERIVADPQMTGRSIGVVTLLGPEQGKLIWDKLTRKLDTASIQKHRIAVGDARTFQGKERDIIFLSLVAAPGNVKASTQEMIGQRFNVAASRARDRMYLVRSVELDDLSAADVFRSGLLRHFKAPFGQAPEEVQDLRKLCESPFEEEVYDLLTERGYRVTPQVPVGSYRIDLVVEGETDQRLAIECDGDRYHGPDQWDNDTRRQRILERAGWTFWRCFASTFVMEREAVMEDLFETLKKRDIHPTAPDVSHVSRYVETIEISPPPLAQSGVFEDGERAELGTLWLS